jgi:hypothetical protein
MHFFRTYRGPKFCTSVLKYVSLRVPTHKVRDFLTFSVSPSNKHCPSAQCAFFAEVVDKYLGIFANGAAPHHIL